MRLGEKIGAAALAGLIAACGPSETIPGVQAAVTNKPGVEAAATPDPKTIEFYIWLSGVWWGTISSLSYEDSPKVSSYGGFAQILSVEQIDPMSSSGVRSGVRFVVMRDFGNGPKIKVVEAKNHRVELKEEKLTEADNANQIKKKGEVRFIYVWRDAAISSPTQQPTSSAWSEWKDGVDLYDCAMKGNFPRCENKSDPKLLGLYGYNFPVSGGLNEMVISAASKR